MKSVRPARGSGQSTPRAARVLAFVLGGLVLASLLLPVVVRKMPDFEVYWRAGSRALAAQPLYRADDGHYQLKYLPAFAVAMAPFALLPIHTAKIVWMYLIVAIGAGFVALSIDLLPSRRTAVALLTTAAVIGTLKFFLHEWTLGQDNALMGLLALAAVARLRKNRPATAGALLAAAVVVKPYAIAFLPYLLISRQWKASAWLAAVLAVVLGVPALAYGFSGNAALLAGWARTVTESTPANLLNQDNVSIWAMYGKWFGVGTLEVVLAAGTIVLAGMLFLWLCAAGRDQAHPEYLEVASLLLLLPIVSPQGWDYVLLLSVPALVLLANHFLELTLPVRAVTAVAAATMAFSVFDVMGRTAYARFMSLSVITVCALVLFGAVASLRLRRVA